MKKQIILTILISIFLIGLISASIIPLPHGFNGEIIVKDDSSPDGLTLIGKINGIETGSCIIEGNSYDIVVVTNYSETGRDIEFYVGGEKAEESFSFFTFEITETDLTFNTIPLDLGDCKKCSSGYECINRICEKKDTDSSNDNDGDDSSSDDDNGWNPLGNNPIQQDSITNDSDNQNDILSIKALNEADKQRETSPRITGGVIGFLKSGGGLVAMIFVILIIVIGIGVIVIQKKPKTSKNE